jgi:hypothetical protein
MAWDNLAADLLMASLQEAVEFHICFCLKGIK